MRGSLPGLLSLVLVSWMLASLDGRSQFKEGGKDKGPASAEAKLFKDMQKAYEKLSKLGPGDEDKAIQEMQKLHDKLYRPPPSEEERYFKDMKKAYDQAYKPPPDDEEKALKELKKYLEQAARSGADAAESARALSSGAAALFSYFDQNADGILNTDEMSQGLRSQLSWWDRNGDGLIGRKEYEEYLQARLQQMLAGKGPPATPPGLVPEAMPPEEEPRPTVYRAGKLPPDLPSWFQEYDSDGDGQITLYEWRTTSGRPLDVFRELDRNGDGFLTIPEVLFWQRESGERAALKLATRDPTAGKRPPAGFATPGPNEKKMKGEKQDAKKSLD